MRGHGFGVTIWFISSKMIFTLLGMATPSPYNSTCVRAWCCHAQHGANYKDSLHCFEPYLFSCGTEPFSYGAEPFSCGTEPFFYGTEPFFYGTESFSYGTEPFSSELGLATPNPYMPYPCVSS